MTASICVAMRYALALLLMTALAAERERLEKMTQALLLAMSREQQKPPD